MVSTTMTSGCDGGVDDDDGDERYGGDEKRWSAECGNDNAQQQQWRMDHQKCGSGSRSDPKMRGKRDKE